MNVWALTREAALMIVASSAFAAWQYHGYQHERALIDESVHEQAHSVVSALIGGVNSHRGFGYYFKEQLQGILDELVKSQDVIAAAIVSKKSDVTISATDGVNLPTVGDVEPGDYWVADGFQLIEPFHLAPAASGGGGGGFGRGFGRGQGPAARSLRDATDSAPIEEGEYLAILLLDRSRSDKLKSHALQSRLLVTATGWLVIGLVALAWRSSVKAVAARGQARLLEIEAKHLRDLSQAAAGLAHETRNPLGLIRGWTQRLAEAGGDDEMRRKHARAVIEECDRVTARINQFLAFAKPRNLAPEPVELTPLVNELRLLLQPDLDAKNVVLETDLERRPAVVTADRELLRQSLFNLIQNAIQFSAAGGAVSIMNVAGKNSCSSIKVCDRGPGVKAEIIESLFTPYVTTRSDGTGLGLAIVRKIASLHGWQVSYQPREGGGAVFSLDGIHG